MNLEPSPEKRYRQWHENAGSVSLQRRLGTDEYIVIVYPLFRVTADFFKNLYGASTILYRRQTGELAWSFCHQIDYPYSSTEVTQLRSFLDAWEHVTEAGLAALLIRLLL